MSQKLAPDPFLILLNNPKQPLDARKSLKEDVFKEAYQKVFKKLTLFFLLNQSLLMDKVIKSKSGLDLVTSCSSGYETSSKTFLYSLYII